MANVIPNRRDKLSAADYDRAQRAADAQAKATGIRPQAVLVTEHGRPLGYYDLSTRRRADAQARK